MEWGKVVYGLIYVSIWVKKGDGAIDISNVIQNLCFMILYVKTNVSAVIELLNFISMS